MATEYSLRGKVNASTSLSGKTNSAALLKGQTTKAESLSGDIEGDTNIQAAIEIPQVIPGESAYEIAVKNGFEGTEEEWIKYLKGTVYPKYEGAYEITPKVEAQALPTAEKVLMKDVIIEQIPYFEVSNTVGGETVTIA